MFTRMLITLLGLHFVTPSAYAVIIVYLTDKVDDREVIDEVAEEEEVKEFGKRLRLVSRELYRMKEEQIEKAFGKPADNPREILKAPSAYSVAQPRKLYMSGMAPRNPKKDKRHIEVYLIKDVACVKVHYSPYDGVTPILVIVSFPVDKSFPKLTVDNLEERLRWEAERIQKIEQRIENAKPKDG